jgi:hypothetical protein
MRAEVMNAKRVCSTPPSERLTTKVQRAGCSAEGQMANPVLEDTKKRPAVEDHVTEAKTKPGRTELLRLWQDKWEALECCRIREEELTDAGLLVQPLIPTRARVSSECVAIIRELRRMAAQELLKQNTVVGQSSAQVPRDEDGGKDRPEHSVSDGSNKVPAVEIVTTDPMTMLRGLFLHSWEALERCRFGEELLHEKGLPTHCLAAARAQLGKVMHAILAEDRRNDAQAFFIKYVVGSEASPAEPLSEAAKQALKGILQQLSPKDRRVLRQLLDRARPAETSFVKGGAKLDHGGGGKVDQGSV